MRFLHSFSLRLGSEGVVFAAALGNQILISRMLGPEGMGHYKILATTVMLLVVAFGEAIGRSNAYLVGGDPKSLAPLSTNTVFYGMAVGVVLSGIFLFGAFFSLWPDRGGRSIMWFLAFLVVAATVLYRGLQMLFLGLERMGVYNVLPAFFALVYLIGNGIALKGIGGGLVGVMTSWAIAGTLAFLLAYRLLKRMSDKKPQSTQKPCRGAKGQGSWRALPCSPAPLLPCCSPLWRKCVRSIGGSLDGRLFIHSMRLGFRAMWISLLLVLLFRVDIYLVDHFLGEVATGVYSIAIVFAEMLQKIPNVAGTVLFSKIAGGVREEEDRLTARVSRSILAITVVAAGGIALVGGWLTPFLFGAEFEGAYLPLLCMLPGVLAMASGSVVNTNLWARGYPLPAVIAPIAAVCTNLALNVFLIPKIGLIGAGLAKTVAYVLWAGLLFGYFATHASLSVRELVVIRRSDFVLRTP